MKKKEALLPLSSRGAIVAAGDGPATPPPPAAAHYRDLLRIGQDVAHSQLHEGYQDYLDNSLDIGKAIDLNTQQYKYIGYFSALRQAIELAWEYPQEASRRGLDGEVRVYFALGRDGTLAKVTVIHSSGYVVLDQAIVEAIEAAAPFNPLPDHFEAPMRIRGEFRYVLR